MSHRSPPTMTYWIGTVNSILGQTISLNTRPNIEQDKNYCNIVGNSFTVPIINVSCAQFISLAVNLISFEGQCDGLFVIHFRRQCYFPSRKNSNLIQGPACKYRLL